MKYAQELILWLGYSAGCLVIGLCVVGITFCYCFTMVCIKDMFERRFNLARNIRAYYSWQRFCRRYNDKAYSKIEIERAKRK